MIFEWTLMRTNKEKSPEQFRTLSLTVLCLTNLTFDMHFVSNVVHFNTLTCVLLTTEPLMHTEYGNLRHCYALWAASSHCS